MDLQLSSKTACVSGSTQGIGYAVAEALLEQGATVIINGRVADRVRAAVASLKVAVPGGVVSGIAADFEDPDQMRHCDKVSPLGTRDAPLSSGPWGPARALGAVSR